jgi:hypothetical protein
MERNDDFAYVRHALCVLQIPLRTTVFGQLLPTFLLTLDRNCPLSHHCRSYHNMAAPSMFQTRLLPQVSKPSQSSAILFGKYESGATVSPAPKFDFNPIKRKRDDEYLIDSNIVHSTLPQPPNKKVKQHDSIRGNA